MDHLGIDRFLVIGCCIGCSYILKLAALQPNRIVAGIMMQPIGLDETNPGFFNPRIYKEWGEQLAARRADISSDDVDHFGKAMWDHEFVISVPREFLPTVQIPLLVMPGNDMAHPFGVGMEVAKLLPQSELVERWKEPETVPDAIESMRSFLKAHTPLEVA
jgi:pimeloyl-ACP methyl ester carboxylesterase